MSRFLIINVDDTKDPAQARENYKFVGVQAFNVDEIAHLMAERVGSATRVLIVFKREGAAVRRVFTDALPGAIIATLNQLSNG